MVPFRNFVGLHYNSVLLPVSFIFSQIHSCDWQRRISLALFILLVTSCFSQGTTVIIEAFPAFCFQLEEVMETETYKNAKLILERFDPESKRKAVSVVVLTFILSICSV